MRFCITIDTEDEDVALRLLGALKDVGLVQATEAVVASSGRVRVDRSPNVVQLADRRAG